MEAEPVPRGEQRERPGQGRLTTYTLDKHGGLLKVQEEMVQGRDRLKDFDNAY